MAANDSTKHKKKPPTRETLAAIYNDFVNSLCDVKGPEQSKPLYGSDRNRKRHKDTNFFNA